MPMPISSPKSFDGESVASNNNNNNNNNKGGHCLCSPTTHQGSFRCRFHRSNASTWMMKRSNSMPITRPSKSTTTTTTTTTNDQTRPSFGSFSPKSTGSQPRDTYE
ncbi:hypothetical protein SOVF_119870 [Spinacia oleracea]|nr:hypothetical protein SOVF_119870 [Spinacia oleracea]